MLTFMEHLFTLLYIVQLSPLNIWGDEEKWEETWGGNKIYFKFVKIMGPYLSLIFSSFFIILSSAVGESCSIREKGRISELFLSKPSPQLLLCPMFPRCSHFLVYSVTNCIFIGRLQWKLYKSRIGSKLTDWI